MQAFFDTVKDLSKLLLALYRGAAGMTPERYRDWALEQLRPRVPFDAGLWMTGYLDDGRFHPTQVHPVRLPAEALGQYKSVADFDCLARRAAGTPGTAVIAVMQEAGKNPMFRYFIDRWQLALGLALIVVDSTTMLATCLTLFRGPGRPPFDDCESRFLESAAPHLVGNHAISTLSQMIRTTQGPNSGALSSAIADRFANLQVAPPDFQQLMGLEWPDWQEGRLPRGLRMLAEGKGTRYAGKHIVIRASRMNDLFLLQARQKLPADDLSERELTVARLLASGLTYKEAAQRLGVAPSTVRNHLTAIFTKLRVRKQSEMAAALRALE